jgi:hypothetical protein
MGEVELLQKIEEKRQHAIGNVQGSRDYYRRGSLIQTVSLAALSATTTLLIGLNEIYKKPALVAVSLATGGLATVMAAWSSWFSFRKLWVNNTVALNRLWELRDRIDYDKAEMGQPPQEQLIEYQNRLQQIFNDLNNTWVQVRQET